MANECQELEAELAALRPQKLADTVRDRLAEKLQEETAAEDALAAELTALAPVRPSPGLRRQLGTTMNDGRSRWPWRRLTVAVLAAAAAVPWLLLPPAARQPALVPGKVQSDLVVDAPGAVEPKADEAAPLMVPALAFSDPRAQKMLATGYTPVSLEQIVVDAALIEPEVTDNRQMRVRIMQSIRWNHRDTGVEVDTRQMHEAVIREDLALY